MTSGIQFYKEELAAFKRRDEDIQKDWENIVVYMFPTLGDELSNRLKGIDKSILNEIIKENQSKFQNIVNGFVRDAFNIASSAIFNGNNNPSSHWFNLTTDDKNIAEDFRVKSWLERVNKIYFRIFEKSNFYDSAYNICKNLIAFGPGPMTIEEDLRTVIFTQPLQIGSYWMGYNERNEIDVLYSERQMTARNIVNRFGKENVSQKILNKLDTNKSYHTFPIIHVYRPQTNQTLKDRFPYESIYFEKNCSNDDKSILSRRGFKGKRFVVPRWENEGSSPYGTGMAIHALADCKQVHMMEDDKLDIFGKIANPPVNVPISIINGANGLNTSAGGVNVFNDSLSTTSSSRVTTTYVPEISPTEADKSIERVEERVNRIFHTHLFTAIMDKTKQMTVFESGEVAKEKALLLGSMMRYQKEFLSPVIDITWEIGNRFGVFPEAPEFLEGRNFEVEYVSPFAQTQKQAKLSAMELLKNYVIELSQVFPDSARKFNARESIDLFADIISAPATSVVPDEVLEQEDKIRELQQRIETLQANIAQGADTAKTLSETNVGDGQNALERLTQLAG